MSAAVPNFDRSLGFLLSDINRLTRQEFDRRVRPLGVTRAQWLFLFYVARQPGCTQSELAETLQIQKITVSRQAERLVRARWLQRRDDARDGRAYRLFLTAKAGRIVARLTEVAVELRDDYLAGIPPARREALVDDLQKIKANLQTLGSESRKKSALS
ncbi:MAG: MarR family transcriptional regulator [Opitutae bacterium]|nr:MarR family transcriptional regulator [Opitutae bacterium]